MSNLKLSPPKFLELLNEELDVESSERERSYRGSDLRHNPSSASVRLDNGETVGACLRQLYWKSTGEPESDKRSSASRLQAGFGDAIHKWLLEKLQKSKRIRLTPESAGRTSVDGLNKEISYRLDGLVTHNGEVGGLEIKTTQSFGLSRMIKEGGPKPDHILQIMSYFGVNPDLQWFSLIYFGRDTAYRAEYHIIKSENTMDFTIECIYPERKTIQIPSGMSFEGIIRRWSELEGHIESKTLPARDYKAVLTNDGEFTEKRVKNGVDYKSDWRCTYCGFKTKCWSMPDAKEASMKLSVTI